MNKKLIVCGDSVGLNGWGCVSLKVVRINYTRGLFWGQLHDVRNGMSNRASKHSFDDIVTVNNKPIECSKMKEVE